MINEDCIDLSIFNNDLIYEDDLWEQFVDDIWDRFAEDEQYNEEFCEVMKELKSDNIDSSALEKYY